jgi:hypothetical protein
MSHIDRTSLAHHVYEVLSKLSKSSLDWPVYHALKKTLDADDDEKLFEGLKLLLRALRELKRQVEACPMLVVVKNDSLAEYRNMGGHALGKIL